MEDEDPKPVQSEIRDFQSSTHLVKMEDENAKSSLFQSGESKSQDYTTNHLGSLSPGLNMDAQNHDFKKEKNDYDNINVKAELLENNDNLTAEELMADFTEMQQRSVPLLEFASSKTKSNGNASGENSNSLNIKTNVNENGVNGIIAESTTYTRSKRKGKTKPRKYPANFFNYSDEEKLDDFLPGEREEGLRSKARKNFIPSKKEVEMDSDQLDNGIFELSVTFSGSDQDVGTSQKAGTSHGFTQTEFPFKCTICSQTFERCRELSKHMKIHTQQQLYICSICDASFFICEDLETHMKSHMEDIEIPKHKCMICYSTFSDEESLVKHTKTHSTLYSYDVDNSQTTNLVKIAEQLKEIQVKKNANNTNENSVSKSKPRYKCSQCNSVFISPSSLASHFRTHTGEKPFQCSICKMTFGASNNLLTHMRKHTGERPYKCTLCGRGFTKSSDVTRHMKTHTRDKPHICSECGKGFSNKTRLAVHKRRNHSHSKVKPFVCAVCGKTFSQKSNWSQHVKVHERYRKIYDDVNITPSDVVDDKTIMSADYQNITEVCKISGKTMITDDNILNNINDIDKDSLFIKHASANGIRGQMDDVLDLDVSFPSQSSIANSHAKHQEMITPAEISHLERNEFLNFNSYDTAQPLLKTRSRKKSKMISSLKDKTDFKKGSFKCTDCDKDFRSASALNIHVRTHTGERPFNCPLCDWTFSIMGNLKAHMKTHSGEKPYQCEVCDKAFTKKCDVKRHLLIHTGERNHVCPTCGKTFSQKCVLNTHMMIHTGEKPYICTQCGKTFSQRAQLITHSKCHNDARPFVCEICDKTFRDKKPYDIHKRIHSGEMPFQCTTCGRFFRDVSYLRKHMKSHDKVKN